LALPPGWQHGCALRREPWFSQAEFAVANSQSSPCGWRMERWQVAPARWWVLSSGRCISAWCP